MGPSMTSRAASLSIVVLLWAALYLPFLGLSELRGEEGKRVMPAVQMLDRGNYLVPYLGAWPYLNKPPMVSWLVAASFRTLGIRNEWGARLPSAVFVLIVALAIVTVGRINLGAMGSMIAAVCWLTTLEMIAKGRVIETDAINASFFALASILWLTWWEQNRSPWLAFTVPWILLALGFLTKGPGLLLFFYAIVAAVSWKTRRVRELVHPAHWLGIAIMLTIFAAWAIPFFLTVQSQPLGQVWLHEVAAILFGEKGHSENWALNFPRAIGFFLPWILVLPFVRLSKIDNLVEREIARGLVWGSLVPFVVVLLLPGTAPRYVLPLIVPLCWLIGVVVANDAFEWRIGVRDFQISLSPEVVKLTIAIALVAEVTIFPIRTSIDAKGHKVLKPAATQINDVMPADESVYAVDLPYEPYLFYVRAPVFYFATLEELPATARFLLIQSRDLAKMETKAHWHDLQPSLIARTASFRSNDTMLFKLNTNEANR